MSVLNVSQQSVCWYGEQAMGCKINNLWFNSQYELITPHLPPFQVARLALEPTQLPIQQVPGVVYPVVVA
jgi:hypothetical protein